MIDYARAYFLPRRKNDASPDLAEDLQYIWDWFIELHSTRQVGFSVNAISYQEIESFCRLTGAIIPYWELSVIRTIDRVFLSIANKTSAPLNREATESDVEESKLRIRGASSNRRVVQRNAKAG